MGFGAGTGERWPARVRSLLGHCGAVGGERIELGDASVPVDERQASLLWTTTRQAFGSLYTPSRSLMTNGRARGRERQSGE